MKTIVIVGAGPGLGLSLAKKIRGERIQGSRKSKSGKTSLDRVMSYRFFLIIIFRLISTIIAIFAISTPV